MKFIYHFVPKEMRGTMLYPLNVLQGVYPDLYEKEVKKYKGREFVKEQKIPLLDCLWNDVLHFTAVHPREIKGALAKLGDNDRLFECFEVDPKNLLVENSIVYLYKHKKKEDKMKRENFEAYSPNAISKYDVIPKEAIECYRKVLKEGGRPLLFHRIPHILYRGNLDVKEITRIKV